MALGFFTGDNSPSSYETIQRRRKLAEALIAQSQDGAPIQSWTQGGAKLVQALSGAIQNRRLDAKEKESNEAFSKTLASLLGGGGPSAMGGAAPSMPSVSMGGAGSPARSTPPSGNQAEFIKAMMPHAMKVAQETGLDPRLVIAKSALETGWGKSAPGNNFFGVKSHGQPGGNNLATNEVIGGQNVRVNDSFRAYSGMGESAADYAAFLKKNPRYGEMLKSEGLEAQIAALGRSGYATDPNYAQKISSIAGGIQLPQGQPQPMQVASAGGMTPDGMPMGPVPSNAPPMSFAAGQQPAPPSPFGSLDAAQTAMSPQGSMPAPNAAQAGPAPMPQQQQPQPGAALVGALGGQQPQQPQTSPPIPQPQPTGNVQAAMMQILSDPRFSPQQKQQAMQMFQMQQAQNNKNPMIIPEGGTLYDPRTGRMMQPTQKKSDQERQYEAAQRGGFQGSFFDYQSQLRRSGATNVNIDQKGEASYDQTMGKGLAEDYRGLIEAGRAATGKIAKYEQLKTALDRTYTGAGGQTVLQLKRLAKSVGVDKLMGVNIDDVGDAEFANALGNQLALELRNPAGGAGMPGALSDKDREFLVASIANVDKTPEGNKKLLDMMIGLERRNQQVMKLANDYARDNKRLSPAFFDQLSQWSEKNPLFAPPAGQQQAPGGASRADPAGALQAARDAIARGAPRDAVLKRLQENGINPAGL